MTPTPEGLFSSWRGQQGTSIFSGLVVATEFRQEYSRSATAPMVAMGATMVFAEMLASLAGLATAPTPSSEPKRATPPRHDELRWIQAHADELVALDGQWIVVDGTRLIASGPRLTGVVAEAEAKGINNPFVYRVEAARPEIAHMGL